MPDYFLAECSDFPEFQNVYVPKCENDSYKEIKQERISIYWEGHSYPVVVLQKISSASRFRTWWSLWPLHRELNNACKFSQALPVCSLACSSLSVPWVSANSTCRSRAADSNNHCSIIAKLHSTASVISSNIRNWWLAAKVCLAFFLLSLNIINYHFLHPSTKVFSPSRLILSHL